MQPCNYFPVSNNYVDGWLIVQIEEYAAERPELKKQIEEDIKNQNWYMPKDIKV